MNELQNIMYRVKTASDSLVVSRQPDFHPLSFGAASALFESELSWQLKQK